MVPSLGCSVVFLLFVSLFCWVDSQLIWQLLLHHLLHVFCHKQELRLAKLCCKSQAPYHSSIHYLVIVWSFLFFLKFPIFSCKHFATKIWMASHHGHKFAHTSKSTIKVCNLIPWYSLEFQTLRILITLAFDTWIFHMMTSSYIISFWKWFHEFTSSSKNLRNWWGGGFYGSENGC